MLLVIAITNGHAKTCTATSHFTRCRQIDKIWFATKKKKGETLLAEFVYSLTMAHLHVIGRIIATVSVFIPAPCVTITFLRHK